MEHQPQFRVLLIDDDEDDYIITQALLSEVEGRRFALDWARNYDQGEELIGQNLHDVYLIDYRLGKHNGLDLMRQAIANGCNVPMILLTGQGDWKVDIEAMKAGAADYLVKDKLDAQILERSIRYAIERKRAERDLKDAKAAAEAANQAKNVFLTTMSHELRTPLHAIIGFGEILYEDAKNLDQIDLAQDLEKICIAGHHLLSMINSILDLAKLESGQSELQLFSFNLPTLINKVVIKTETQVQKNQNLLIVNCHKDIGSVHADPKKIEQILYNLVSNAAKFSHQGVITLSVTLANQPIKEMQSGKKSDTWLVITVTDTGIGIASENMERIFEPFIQIDDSMSRKYEGTGLGLAISRRYCQVMGGDILVESSLGKGSIFTAQFPLKVIHQLAAS